MAEKSNEIIAIPRLLDMLAIEGAIVTIDAMGKAGPRFRQAQPDGMARRGCQREIAKKIIDKKADYVLALKGNQGSLHEDVAVFAAEQKARNFADTKISQDTTIDGDHGRIEIRTTTVIHDVEWLRERHDWPSLNAVVMVESSREVGGKTEQETRFTSPHWSCWRTSSGRSCAATGRSRTACTGSWTWSSAMTSAAPDGPCPGQFRRHQAHGAEPPPQCTREKFIAEQA